MTVDEEFVLLPPLKKKRRKQRPGAHKLAKIKFGLVLRLALCGETPGSISKKVHLATGTVRNILCSKTGVGIMAELTEEMNDGIKRRAIHMRHDATKKLATLLDHPDWRAKSYAIDRIHGVGLKRSKTDEERVMEQMVEVAGVIPRNEIEPPLEGGDRALMIEHLKRTNNARMNGG